MLRYLKIITITFFIFLFIRQSSFGQRAKTLGNPWENLKEQLLKRVNVATEFIDILQQQKDVDPALPGKLKTNQATLTNLLNTKKLDSFKITSIKKSYDSLSVLLMKSFSLLEQDKKFIKSGRSKSISTELEETENNVRIAIKDFNEDCKKNGRMNLYFKEPWEDTQ